MLWRPRASQDWRRTPLRIQQNDRWQGSFTPDEIGTYEFAIEAWRDPFATWVDEVTKKAAAGQSVELELMEGRALVARARRKRTEQRAGDKTPGVNDESLERLLSSDLLEFMRFHGPRAGVSRSTIFEVTVDRERAAFSSWYELFPRSAANDAHRHGTFSDVICRIPYVRDMGFDVLYFPPLHPIGRTNRKGRNNALRAEIGDPGSVYAIGSAEGGHDAIHPELGTIEDFRRLVREANANGVEIAMDIAWQCSPDHPWLNEHPEWFERRPDGSIKYAENPPKKYEDIVNLRFDGDAYPDVWFALRDVVLFWASQGVRIFRIDNPHTKPLPFWEWMIARSAESIPIPSSWPRRSRVPK